MADRNNINQSLEHTPSLQTRRSHSAGRTPPEQESSGVEEPTKIRRTRVRFACERCRRQKLKCDKERPCSLCVRSLVKCVTKTDPRHESAMPGPKTPDRQIPRKVAETRSPTNATAPLRRAREYGSSLTKAAGPQGRKRKGDDNASPLPSLRQHSQGTSSIGLTREILKEFESESTLASPSFALPGGIPIQPSDGYDDTLRIPIVDLIGIELPAKDVTDFLFVTYLNSVHWFMMVFHEPSFRNKYQEIVISRSAPQRQLRFVAFLMLVLAIGARYATREDAQLICPQIDLDVLQTTLLAKVQEFLLEIFDQGEIESIQICIMLGTLYLYHGRPNLAFVIIGTGVKCAQVMGLHRESTWPNTSEIVREERKRVWWALYVVDRFVSIVFGRPCSLFDSDSEVSMVRNLEDTSERHPTLHSMETMEDGSIDHVTILSYQRYKFRLYRIASPIVGDVYFHRDPDISNVVERVRSIHEKLIAWFGSLPSELRLNREMSRTSPPVSPVIKTFNLQALALQLAYDNIQILLHRPLLSYNLRTLPPTLRTANHSDNDLLSSTLEEVGSGLNTPIPSSEAFFISKSQCWESAVRTSKLSKEHQCLVAALDTHAASYNGIQMFTAGTVLSIVALSSPLSSQAQEAKQAIARVIRICNMLERRTTLSAQGGRILEELVRLILDKEMKSIFAQRKDNVPSPARHGFDRPPVSSLVSPRVSLREPQPPQMDAGAFDSLDQRTSQRQGEIDQQYSGLQDLISDSDLGMYGFYEGEGVPLGYADFNEGIQSLQQVIYHNALPVTTEFATLSSDNDQNMESSSYGQPGDGSAFDGGAALFGGGYGGIKDLGQAWLWEPNPLQF